MKNLGLNVQKRTLSIFRSAILLGCIFLFAGITQTSAQTDAVAGSSPYGGKVFVSASEAQGALQFQLSGLYTQLNFLTEGTKPYKRVDLQILCYKGIISDLTAGQGVETAYEENLATFSQSLNLEEDPADLSFLRVVQSGLFELLTY